MAKRWGFTDLDIEVDSAISVNLLESNSEEHPLRFILLECRELMSCLSARQVCHIFRDANVCVDHLASRDQVGEERMLALNEPLASILYRLREDKEGVERPRRIVMGPDEALRIPLKIKSNMTSEQREQT
ncbi:Ribonuclease H domain [Dillenia turbinata]|uniref:Ribonuclease H domain n=1 Tax=Dillenia turbinata TaxID=194707 RepID=A0AAN8Z9E6_9MAGN